MPLGEASMELKQIYILAHHYGTGLGRQLYNDAIKRAQGMGKTWLWLSVSDINDRAKSFYAKLGFEAVGAGPTFEVGTDRLTSTTLAKRI